MKLNSFENAAIQQRKTAAQWEELTFEFLFYFIVFETLYKTFRLELYFFFIVLDKGTQLLLVTWLNVTFFSIYLLSSAMLPTLVASSDCSNVRSSAWV